ncbi:glycosyltransferase [Candidatus Cryptobacteroides sp.]|uniref:glycosyltransferase n=1 Tax=Candidatus Cryptobacteroides sp. TaxID=2952915 RepID=UPI002A7545DA|nr:glycosyltransferase [Candidatus Cryptobacteroides sp.]
MYCIRGLHNSGGMERVLSVKANLLASRGHEVSIVVLRLKGRKPFFPIDPSVNIVDLSAPYLSLPGHSSSANATSDSPRSTVSSAVGNAANPSTGSARTESIAYTVSSAVGSTSSPATGNARTESSTSSSASCSARTESSAAPISSAVGSTSRPSTGSARTESSASSPATERARTESSASPASSAAGIAPNLATGAAERLKGSVRKRLSRVVEMLDPDVCVSLCGPEVRILPAVAGGRPCVAEYHFSHDKFYRKYGGIFMYPYAWLRTHMLERAVSEYDCMVTLTEHDLPIWKRHCRRVERIFNPVTTPPGQVSRLAEKRMIAVGRLEDQKNFKDLVSAWSIVAERCPDWRLEIFGEGKLEHALRSQIARLGLTGSVILRGVVKDIASEYSNSSALLMTSLHEGFPLALVEASSFGLPLISYDCPTGPSEIIVDAGDGGVGNVPAATLDQAAGNTPNGYLVPVGDVRTLADRICRIASDDNLRLRLGAASKASSHRFTPETIISAWEHLFSSLL